MQILKNKIKEDQITILQQQENNPCPYQPPTLRWQFLGTPKQLHLSQLMTLEQKRGQADLKREGIS